MPRLNCCLHWRIGVPFQKPDAGKNLKLNVLRLDRQRGFVLTKAPLMRVALFQGGTQDSQFVWTFHHAILDGRSFATILNEVFAFYDAISRGQELELPQPPPFQNFIEWLKQQNFSKIGTILAEATRRFHVTDAIHG